MSGEQIDQNSQSTSDGKVKKRKIQLYNWEVPHDYGRKYRKELLDAHLYDKEEQFFMMLAKVLLTAVILFVVIMAIFYNF